MGWYNSCGQGASKDHFYSPVLINVGNLNKISSFCCSKTSTIVQTMNGEWYGFGEEDYKYNTIYGKKMTLTPQRIDDAMPKGIQIKKLVATGFAFFMLTTGNDLYVVGKGKYGEMGMNNEKNIEKWTLCKTNIADVQTGIDNSFLFIPNSFLVYEFQMKFTDVSIE